MTGSLERHMQEFHGQAVNHGSGGPVESSPSQPRSGLRSSPVDYLLPALGVWTGALDFVPATRARELAAELEQVGYGAVWLPEVAGRDVMAHLALLLSSTERLVGATGIASIWARDAVTMVGGLRALTEAFPERVVLGLGVSHQN